MKYKKISKELIEMFNLDQYYAKNYNAKKFKETVMNNTKKLKQIIRKYGWPNSERFGEKAELGAWIIAQHNDWNVKFQEGCLKLMLELPKLKKRKQHIAYLTDRILVNKKRRQIYGTQFTMGRNQKMKPRPIKDIKNLAKRRRQMRLEDSKIYKKRMSKFNKIK
jgi:hypothetical protein